MINIANKHFKFFKVGTPPNLISRKIKITEKQKDRHLTYLSYAPANPIVKLFYWYGFSS